MSQPLLKLSDTLLLKVIYYLNLQDLQQLGQTNQQLRDLVYNNTRVWHQHVLFPPKDSRLTDQFIRHLVPQITRHYGIHTLRLIQLPLTWQGYMFIFDQFAHSVDHIQLETTLTVLQDLVHHLTIFAANLALIQQDNNIPITFRQYCLFSSEYYQVLVDHQFLGGSNVAHITRLFMTKEDSTKHSSAVRRLSELDDPPFERLLQWQVKCTDHPSELTSVDCMAQLESLISFLAGHPVNKTSSSSSAVTAVNTTAIPSSSSSSSSPTIPSNIGTTPYIMAGQKRSQDQLDPSNRQRQKLVSPPRASSLYV
ncbi:hypothetical protein BC941DRAFT_419950 [Chlamydoabsidia padenii]|nr:hypothetical protein BC941DRAFT_419950 [Chlamydoabsidia padenii]